MKPYGVNELRKMYLEYFEKNGHLCMNSFSLVPHNDNSLLLINAGMAPLKPYFTGQEEPPRHRMATCQKCIRTGDIENVGKTARHLTFFEMLGNFSFGDYFKKEALQWSWEFLTKVIGLEEERLYPSIYGEDEEAFEIWTKVIGVPAEKITRFYRDENGECDNFWEHGAGPCGPCSEIYYDRGEKYGCGSPDCKVGCDCDRFMEVWNDVFTQFEGDGHGNYTELENKNIDTGMGLERLAVVVQDVDSVFDIDTMKAIRDKVCALSGQTYHTDALHDISIRLITDHIRSAVFMIGDGISPSNEGRGYVLRRLIRRAARHGRLLGIKGTFLAELALTVISECEDGYPELRERQELITRVLTQEEENFNRTIDQGLSLLGGIRERMKKMQEKVLSGEEVFKLYDTYGFPVDLTEEILQEAGLRIDMEGFKKAMERQREMARNARKETNYMGADATVLGELDPSVKTEFVGYTALTYDSAITAMSRPAEAKPSDAADGDASSPVDELVEELKAGEKGTILTEQTPFYATKGGQNADTGVIRGADGVFVVTDTVTLPGEKTGHVGYVSEGVIRSGERVTLEVDATKRARTAKNHSATHLLQKALQMVLGDHVHQAGSDVNEDRLRFDFSHFSAMSDEEIRQVEELVNAQIAASLPVVTDVMGLEEAKKSGAMALFGEKYGESVRVVRMGDFSTELCGGTHVDNTSKIAAFKIVSEGGVSAGVRRIEALTSDALFAYYDETEAQLKEAAGLLKTTPGGVAERIAHLQAEVKALHAELESLKSKEARAALGDVTDQVEEVGGVKLIATEVADVDMNGLRELGDQLKEKLGEGVVVLASAKDGKVSLVAMATDGAVKAGAHAGNLIKAIAGKVGGGGGGRPNMAQAGGKNPAGIAEAIGAVKEVLSAQVGA